MKRWANRSRIRIRIILAVSVPIVLACLALNLFLIHREKNMAKEALTTCLVAD